MNEKEAAHFLKLSMCLPDFKNYIKKLPKPGSSAYYQLLYLTMHIRQIVKKQDITDFVQSKNPKASGDQQVRHLAAKGFFLLKRGDQFRDISYQLKSGEYCLVSLCKINPEFLNTPNKRISKLNNTSFGALKAAYNNRCATCGSEETKPHRYHQNTITNLQQGHMDPNQPLTPQNTIPQCQFCNQSMQDDYVFDEYGLPRKVNSTRPLQSLPLEQQSKIISELFEKMTNQQQEKLIETLKNKQTKKALF